MAFKINISDKGKTYKVETESESLVGKSIGDTIPGNEIDANLEGYELEITGGSDKSGFPMYSEVEGIGTQRVLLEKGWGMHKRPRGVKKKVPQPKGLRMRKTVRAKTISTDVIQINMIVKKEGAKKLEEIFKKEDAGEEGGEEKAEEGKPEAQPEAQEQPKPEESKEDPKSEEKPAEEKIEEKKEVPKEEAKEPEKKEE
tara:strand:+ start:885 stop:1481 length:597 start_codon:yes stop_codon:yes gene_type:complete